MAVKLTEKQRADAFLLFRRKLREARAIVQADAEAYKAVWNVVESLGDYLWVNCAGFSANRRVPPDDLEPAAQRVLAILFPDPKDPRRSTFSCQRLAVMLAILFPGPSAASAKSSVEVVMASYDRLREARNALVHEGAVSRTLGTHAMRLSVAMEETLMTEMTKLIDSDVGTWMVPDPVTAQLWQTVSQIRVALLSGGYSALPLWREKKGDWYFVRDVSVVQYLRGEGDQHCALSTAIGDCDGPIQNKLSVEPACDWIINAKVCDGRVVKSDKLVDSLFGEAGMDGLPFLIVDCNCPSRLLGVLTPHDLLV